jgi:hypothetical protein
MLKKFLLGFAIAGGLIASAPGGSANECLLRNDCYWDSEDPEEGENGRWVCPNPGIFLLCDG